MGYGLFDILKGLEEGVSAGDDNIGKYLASQRDQEESALKRELLKEQLGQLRIKPEMDQLSRLVEQEKQMIEEAVDEIKRIDNEIKQIGWTGNREYKKQLIVRKRYLLQFLQEMSTVPSIADRLTDEEDTYDTDQEENNPSIAKKEQAVSDQWLKNNKPYQPHTLVKGRI